MPNSGIPESSRVVVIGGGIIGCSVAYHLAEMGCSDVVLLERDQLTSGTTWHAAGLMTTYGSGSETILDIRKHSMELYRRLEEETGQQTGFHPCGFIELAADQDRLEEYRRITAFNRLHGNDIQELSPSEVAELFPFADVTGICAGFYAEHDGRINPVDVTMALAKGARMKGVKILQNTPVREVLTRNGAVTGVRTDQGDIRSEFVVNCAGMWARQLGEQNGVVIPNQAAEHYYLITDKIDGVSGDLPVLEDPSTHAYFREEGGGMMIGLFEPDCAPWKVGGIPDDFSFGELPPDWDRLTPFLEQAMARVPVTMEAGIRKFFCGPESFTPDLAPVIGEAPELRNYFVAAGLNSVGIITGGGYGRVLAHWILNGRPDVDVTGINIDRFQRYQCNPEYRRQRALESLGLVYACHYPDRSPRTARGARKSPFHERLAAKGAHFRDVSGWECPGWYAPEGQEPVADCLTWGRPNWFPWWQAEHQACREGVIAMDMSFMGKFLVQGRDAGAFLNYISANEVNAEAEKITYTQWLNEAGTLEADLTVIKITEETFMVVTSDVAHRHTETWMKRHIGDDQQVFVTDVTSGYGQLNIQGPKSRELLQSITSADLSNEAFPFRTAREIDIGLARVLCVRITYAGELGYELNIPSEQAVHVYDRIVSEGEKLGLKHAGLKALASLRLEKGYRDYGHDIDNLDDPYSTGLGFAVRLDKKGDFIGKQACIERKADPAYRHRLVQIFVKDPEPQLFHQEIVLRNGVPVGDVRAGSYGHTLGGAVGLAMIAGDPVDAACLEEGDWEVEIAGRRYPAEVSLKPLYDPAMERIKA
ncbi:MAG: FAD-dependent oxidoreductase [Gammaproteobacteria bacterium]|jgi:4-methylaminobutanoate oxidase (formaldehyde-forming)|nr:FAD-dependent oxidoreductase [Gammaproteobacteria bacterium]